MGANWLRKWDAGRVLGTLDGKEVWYLERWVNGRQRSFKLRVTSDEDARAELALYNRDPLAYVAAHERRRTHQVRNLALTAELIADFKGSLERLGRSPKYVSDTKTYLDAWRDRLGRADLRRLTLHDLQSHLKHLAAPRKCMIAFKSCLTYAVKQGLIEPDENPARFLKVPPSQRSERSKGYSPEFISKTYAALTTIEAEGRRSYGDETAQAVRDAFRIAAETGCHYTEIERIAQGERAGTHVRRVSMAPDAPIAGVVAFRHKTTAARGGVSHVMSLSPAAFRAVLRLQKRGSAPVESHMREYLSEARARCKFKQRLRLGELRHSFTSIAKTAGVKISIDGGGVSLAEIATVLGHASASTTRKFYDHTDTPPRIELPFALIHPDDPPIAGSP